MPRADRQIIRRRKVTLDNQGNLRPNSVVNI